MDALGLSDLTSWAGSFWTEAANAVEETVEAVLGAAVLLFLGLLLLSALPALLVALAGAPLWVVVLLLVGT